MAGQVTAKKKTSSKLVARALASGLMLSPGAALAGQQHMGQMHMGSAHSFTHTSSSMGAGWGSSSMHSSGSSSMGAGWSPSLPQGFVSHMALIGTDAQGQTFGIPPQGNMIVGVDGRGFSPATPSFVTGFGGALNPGQQAHAQRFLGEQNIMAGPNGQIHHISFANHMGFSQGMSQVGSSTKDCGCGGDMGTVPTQYGGHSYQTTGYKGGGWNVQSDNGWYDVMPHQHGMHISAHPEMGMGYECDVDTHGHMHFTHPHMGSWTKVQINVAISEVVNVAASAASYGLSNFPGSVYIDNSVSYSGVSINGESYAQAIAAAPVVVASTAELPLPPPEAPPAPRGEHHVVHVAKAAVAKTHHVVRHVIGGCGQTACTVFAYAQQGFAAVDSQFKSAWVVMAKQQQQIDQQGKAIASVQTTQAQQGKDIFGLKNDVASLKHSVVKLIPSVKAAERLAEAALVLSTLALATALWAATRRRGVVAVPVAAPIAPRVGSGPVPPKVDLKDAFQAAQDAVTQWQTEGADVKPGTTMRATAALDALHKSVIRDRKDADLKAEAANYLMDVHDNFGDNLKMKDPADLYSFIDADQVAHPVLKRQVRAIQSAWAPAG